MSFLSLLGVEFKKIRRSKIILILLLPVLLLWIPPILNADINFNMQAEGISPENNFFVQSFLGFSWFMFPASMVICTVMLNQTERGNKGILKMLALPINTAKLALAKFTVLLILAAVQMVFMAAMYFPSAAAASSLHNYDFMLEPLEIIRQTGLIYLASIPMAAVFWLLAVCIETPVFSIGIGLASIVPSVLMLNTKVWYLYPMDYPFFLTTSKLHELSANMGDFQVDLVPWLPAAAIITVLCLAGACFRFGQAERR